LYLGDVIADKSDATRRRLFIVFVRRRCEGLPACIDLASPPLFFQPSWVPVTPLRWLGRQSKGDAS